MSDIKVKITFHDKREGFLKNQVITGLEVPYAKVQVGDITERIKETEAHLERITGYVVRIETAE